MPAGSVNNVADVSSCNLLHEYAGLCFIAVSLSQRAADNKKKQKDPHDDNWSKIFDLRSLYMNYV